MNKKSSQKWNSTILNLTSWNFVSFSWKNRFVYIFYLWLRKIIYARACFFLNSLFFSFISSDVLHFLLVCLHLFKFSWGRDELEKLFTRNVQIWIWVSIRYVLHNRGISNSLVYNWIKKILLSNSLSYLH